MEIEKIVIPYISTDKRTVFGKSNDVLILFDDYLEVTGKAHTETKKEDDEYLVEENDIDYSWTISKDHIKEIICRWIDKEKIYCLSVYTSDQSALNFDFQEREDAFEIYERLIKWRFGQ